MPLRRPDSAHPPTTGRFEFRLPPRLQAPGVARRSVREVLSWAPREEVDRAELIVSELITNSVRHAGLRPDQEILVRVRFGGNRIHVEVEDPGPPFGADPRRRRGAARSGWGMFLVSRMADRWGMKPEDGGKAVWFEVDL